MTQRASGLGLVALVIGGCLEPALTKTNDPPAVAIQEPGDGAVYAEGETVELLGRVVDDGPLEDVRATWFDNGTPLVLDQLPDAEGFVSFATADLVVGSHAITLRALDGTNLAGEDAVTIEVELVDENPTVTIVRPDGTEQVEEGDEFLFEATASDPQDTPDQLVIEVTSDLAGNLCTMIPDTVGAALCRAPLRVVGDHRITFTVFDTDNRSAQRSTILPVEPVPEEPVITVSRPAPGERPRHTQPFAFEAEVSDRQDPPVALVATITSDVDGFVCTMAVAPTGVATCLSRLPTPGTHYLTFEVADTDGNRTRVNVLTQVSDGTDIDDDGDGQTEIAGDCDDANGAVFLGATEQPNGRDDDCDGTADEGTVLFDDDADGYCESVSVPCTDGSDLGDCDDASFFVNPAAREVCGDGIDNNCNTLQDELNAVGCTPYYFDGDRDGFGDPAQQVCRCAPQGAYTALAGTDCNDTLATVNPGAPEVPDGLDNDCDGTRDEGTALYDDDGDGFCESTGQACTDGAQLGDCDDGTRAVNPDAAEVCANGRDDDCDRVQDERDATGCLPWYVDADGDGFGDPNLSSCECAATVQYTVRNGNDCNDANPAVGPGTPEVPDGFDNDCDGVADEGTSLRDDDGDGYCESITTPCTDGALLGDCDDALPTINPASVEVCGNGVDDDCDRVQDEFDAAGCIVFYADNDGDGFGDPNLSSCECSLSPPFVVLNDDDCDDGTILVAPGQAELPDGIDNDCDGVRDEGTSRYDDDGDGYCESTSVACTDGSLRGDCDDAAPLVSPGAAEVCGNGLDDDCDRAQNESGAVGCLPVYADADGDGFGDPSRSSCECAPTGIYVVLNGDDCNDGTVLVGPGQSEIADGVDNDCDGTADEGTSRYDDDGDGYCESTTVACTDGSLRGDCDDGNPLVHPGAVEVCGNAVDENCNAQTNEIDAQGCIDYHADRDNDGYGHPTDSFCACGPNAAYDVVDASDCNDNDAAIRPGATEISDGYDNNCNGVIDEGTDRFDDDGDGYCEATSGSCSDGSIPGDCNDTNRSVSPAAAEVCNNGFDDDCDGTSNEAGAQGCTTWYLDNDRDGYGNPNATLCTCSRPSNGTSDNTDCNDASAAANPAATEIPDGIDNNCSGVADEGTVRFDNDGDGYCANATCTPQPGGTPSGGDCNDGNPAVNPGAREVCDNFADDNCNSQQNEGQNAIGCSNWYRDYDNDGFGNPNDFGCYCQATGVHRRGDSSDCDDANAFVFPGQTGWFRSPRGNGSFDYNCDGRSERQYTGDYECECQVSVFGVPFVVTEFEEGWDNEPNCGIQGIWYTSCYYSQAQLDIFGICNPLGPEISSRVYRTQQCR